MIHPYWWELKHPLTDEWADARTHENTSLRTRQISLLSDRDLICISN